MNEWSWSHLALWFILSVFLNSDICFLILIQGSLSKLLIVILNAYFQVKLLLDIQPFVSYTQLRKTSGSPRLLSFLETVVPVSSQGRSCSDLILCHHLASLSQLLSWIRWSHLLVSSTWRLGLLSVSWPPGPGLCCARCLSGSDSEWVYIFYLQIHCNWIRVVYSVSLGEMLII